MSMRATKADSHHRLCLHSQLQRSHQWESPVRAYIFWPRPPRPGCDLKFRLANKSSRAIIQIYFSGATPPTGYVDTPSRAQLLACYDELSLVRSMEK
ncbi:hypothetical protein EVAR_38816_1 [Eumeta japonica]|uniref:Uncharacterized protein n=1 Tax=Eumeta variegata TaxID=151549 RepID=A0A4C1XPQ8_EUMVA|nr:hypothetical protein EVAR_38816_1 [Eumeta japonica]